MKRQYQTAEIEANNYIVALEEQRLQMKRQAKASNARHRAIAAKQDEPNLFSPALDMYMPGSSFAPMKGITPILFEINEGA